MKQCLFIKTLLHILPVDQKIQASNLPGVRPGFSKLESIYLTHIFVLFAARFHIMIALFVKGPPPTTKIDSDEHRPTAL